MSGIVARICGDKRREVDALKKTVPLESFRDEVSDTDGGRFRAAIAGSDTINIIAELKKASPSKGVLIDNFDVASLAEKYAEGGAAALSVLTERNYFMGDSSYLRIAAEASGLPVLCKDFVVDPYQLYYARWKGADAILLIVSMVETVELKEFLTVADDLGIDCLCEVHDEPELERAKEAGATIIGVNNRDLRDFTVDLAMSERLAGAIPNDIIRIAESGIFNSADVNRLRRHGFNNFLVGEALVSSENPTALIRELRGV